MLDWLWNVVVAPWPDLGTKEFENWRDLAGLATGGLSLLLAALAIKMGWDQDKVSESQRVLLERLTEPEAAQADVAEEQHRLTLELRGRTAMLRMRAHAQRYMPSSQPGLAYTDIDLHIHNFGTRGAGGFDWEAFLPIESQQLRFVDLAGSPLRGVRKTVSGTLMLMVEGHSQSTLYPTSNEYVVTVRVLAPGEFEGAKSVYWRARCEDGVVPPPFHVAEMRLRALGDRTFGVEQMAIPTERSTRAVVDEDTVGNSAG